ncbi:trypsin-like serine peptidase [Streptomyces sp. G5(2025)]|uniref:trypsin-like serine peptidase n=1 Tax=Streptomyces sp. G5(2025) TaxID=3406628 RepID=UPI003C20D334
MRISRWARAVAMGVGGGFLAVSVTTTAGAATPADTDDSRTVPKKSDAAWGVVAAERFWTADRMESATPLTAQGKGQGKAHGEAQAPAGMAAGRGPVAYAAAARAQTDYEGSKTIGVLYFVDKGMATHNCTASVVHSPKGNLILTAGHCGNGDKYAFVPQYRTGKTPAQQPNGIWAVDRVFKDPRRTDYGPGSDLDFAFATVKPDKLGRQVEKVTGANTLTRTPGYQVPVTVIGYPSARNAPKDQAIKCRVKTTRLSGYKQLRMACGGFYGGTSGSPWLMDFDERTKRGRVVGNLGGAGGGGATDSVSYAPFYDDEVFKLYDDAVRNAGVIERPPLPATLGTGETWQHAKRMATGDYTGDGKADLLVVWADGEITLHPGNGKGGFTAERRLQKPNATWQHATAVTGGDFTGTDLSDLMVRWSDGEVTLYEDVSASGFGKETRLAAAGSTWKKAAQLTAGRFGGGGKTDDVVVRRTDGEVILYSDVDGRGFKKKTRLHKPNATWKRTALLTGGDFAGTGLWDLLVRWSDGERTVHKDVSTAGSGTKTRMGAPGALWQHAKVMTAGAYTAGGLPDDLIVRWSDGEVSLYADTTAKLGREVTLVPRRSPDAPKASGPPTGHAMCSAPASRSCW